MGPSRHRCARGPSFRRRPPTFETTAGNGTETTPRLDRPDEARPAMAIHAYICRISIWTDGLLFAAIMVSAVTTATPQSCVTSASRRNIAARRSNQRLHAAPGRPAAVHSQARRPYRAQACFVSQANVQDRTRGADTPWEIKIDIGLRWNSPPHAPLVGVGSFRGTCYVGRAIHWGV